MKRKIVIKLAKFINILNSNTQKFSYSNNNPTTEDAHWKPYIGSSLEKITAEGRRKEKQYKPIPI
jgi:hypothetical protein